MNNEQTRYGVYSITEYEKDGEKKSYWLRLGTAFRNRDDSFNILLKATPLPDPRTGMARLHMRLPKNKAEQDTGDDDSFYLEMDPLYGAPVEAL